MPTVDDIAGLRRILRDCRTIAVVGLSANWYRPSYFAAKYMQDKGYRIIPVNPNYREVLGQKCYADLHSVPDPVDIVDCFRKPDEMVPIARDAVAIHARVLCELEDFVTNESKLHWKQVTESPLLGPASSKEFLALSEKKS
jgi:predicted CoA-binding protein